MEYRVAISHIGGGAGALDNIDGGVLSDGHKAVVVEASGQVWWYNLDTDSGLDEDGTNFSVISPNANAGTKRWILVGKTGRVLIPDDTVDQGDSGIVGTLAWHIADLAGSKGVVTALAGTYDMTTNTTVPVTMEFKPQIGVLFDGSATLTIDSSFSPGRYQVFADDFVVDGLAYAYPEWFGAAADATTDDRTEFNSAFTSLNSEGGTVYLDMTKQYYIASDFTMPKYTALIGNQGYGMIPREAHEWEDAGGVIYLADAASITVSEGGAIAGFNILRYGCTLPANAAEVATWTGTAIRLADHAHNVYIGHMGIATFERAIDNYNTGGVTTKTNFNYCENLKVENSVFDNTNNIRIGNALSTTYWNNIKTGAVATVTLAGVATADLERTGYSFHFAGDSDGLSVVGCTTYGYQNGFRIESGNAVGIVNCQTDHPGTPVQNTPVGYAIVSDDSEVVKISNSHSWGGNTVAVYIDNSMASDAGTVIITGNSFTSSNHNIQVIDGSAIVTGNLLRGGEDGISLGEDADSVVFTGNVVSNTNYIVKTHASFTMANLLYANNKGITIATAITDNWVCPTVASSSTVTLPSGHKTVIISGTTGITSVTTSFPGDRVSLLFEDTLTVTDGSNLKLGGNFSATADDILTLTCDGTNWYQEGNN